MAKAKQSSFLCALTVLGFRTGRIDGQSADGHNHAKTKPVVMP